MTNDLEQVDHVKYLGVVCGNSSHSHVMSRIKACRQSFYALQGSGLCPRGVAPDIIAYLWNTAVNPVLSYNNHCVYLTTADINALDKTQSKLVKSALGLPQHYRNTALFNAVNQTDCG